MTHPVLDRLRGRVVPVIRTGSASSARALVDALAAGGLTIFEITTSVPDHAALLAELARNDRLLVGMGTVLDAVAAHAAIDAGARFVVSPCVVPEVVEAAAARGVPAIPGAATPTEVLAAWRAGAAAVKCFPARQLGGPAFLKAVRSVLPDVPLIPTGGIELDDIDAYLAAGAHAVGMGGQLAAEADAGSPDRLAAATERARAIAARAA